MRTWSKRSKKVHDTLCSELQILTTRLRDEVADISLIYGYRDREEQTILYENGFSELQYPQSKHNKNPSDAVDFQPWPYPPKEEKLWGALSYIAGRAFGIAEEEGFEIRWGGDWDGDGDMTDQDFDDLFHIEVVRRR